MRYLLLKKLGVDQAVFFSLLLRGWQMLAGIVTLLLIARFFSPIQQGFFYTFNSIVLLQIFFEMGLSYVLVQVVSHEFVYLRWARHGRLLGGKQLTRFTSLLKQACRWYVIAAVLFFVVAFPVGEYFFHLKDNGQLTFDWQLAWVLLVLATACNIVLLPFFATVEGGGRVGEVYRVRFIQGFIASWVSWCVLILGGGLYNACAIAFSNVVIGFGWLYLKNPLLLRLPLKKRKKQKASFSWRAEIWPMQWRIAISWMSGYFINQLFVPLLFYYQSPVIAGQMGMSLAVSTMIAFIGQAWLSAKAPRLGNLIAKQEWRLLDKIFSQLFLQSTAMVGLACIGAMVVVSSLQGIALFHRFLPPLQFFCIVCSAFLMHIVNCVAQYLRSHKKDPFMVLSVMGAVLVALCAWFFSKYYSSEGVVISVLAINLVYGLPTAMWAWFHYRKAWHR